MSKTAQRRVSYEDMGYKHGLSSHPRPAKISKEYYRDYKRGLHRAKQALKARQEPKIVAYDDIATAETAGDASADRAPPPALGPVEFVSDRAVGDDVTAQPSSTTDTLDAGVMAPIDDTPSVGG